MKYRTMMREYSRKKNEKRESQMRKTEKVELTTLCMVCADDKILMQNRVKNDWKGYTLPGGHIEPGESIVESAVREIKEETGLTIKNLKLCGVKQFPIEDGRYLVFLFRTNEFEGELVSSEEGQMQWVERSRLQEYPLVDDFAELMQVMESENLNEFLYIVDEDEWSVRIR